MNQGKNTSNLRLFVLVAPILIVSFGLWLINANNPVYILIFGREQLGEWVQAGCYFLASGFGLVAFKSLSKSASSHKNIMRFFLGLFVLGMLFIALEEISWGQQIFKWESSQVFLEYNAQQETNIHNMFWFNSHTLYMLVGIYGGLGWLVKKYVYSQIADVLIPDWHLSIYFFQIFLFYFSFDFILPVIFIIRPSQELFEFVLAIGFLLFSVENLIKIRHTLNSQ